MIFKDFYCTICENIISDIMVDSSNDVEIFSFCDYCKRDTCHKSICNGGIRHRWRYVDWPDDHSFYEGQVRAHSPVAENEDGDVRNKHTKELMHDNPKFKGDKRKERRDKIQHNWKKERGITPLTFDQKMNKTSKKDV